MKNDSEHRYVTDSINSKVDRKPYQKPALQTFGTLKKLTQGPGTSANEGNSNETRRTRPTGSSERAIKTNIVKIGTHPLGIGLYLFDYKPEFQARFGSGRQFGVMAEEVEQHLPDAVLVGEDGIKVVDYFMLGIHRSIN